jgi:uncharacterized protein (DUF4415 family)
LSKEAKAIRRQIVPQETIRIWLDRDVIERFRSTGSGWQGRINDVLRKARVG